MKTRSIHRVLVAAGVAAALFGLSSCPSPVDWSDTEGINLIAARDFGALDGGAPVWQPSDDRFVDFTVAGSGEFPSLTTENSISNTAAVYRLELLNLIPNGDFEAMTAGQPPEDWESTGTTNAEVLSANTYNSSDTAEGIDLAGFHGDRVLSLNYLDVNARFFMDLSASGPSIVPAAFEDGAQFAFFLDFRTKYPYFPLSLNRAVPPADPADETDSNNQQEIVRGNTSLATVSYRFPGTEQENPARNDPGTNTFTVGDTDAYLLSFGGSTTTTENRVETIVDNIRLVRSNLTHAIELSIPLQETLQPTRPPLDAGGTYTLRFWVARDLTAGAGNRFDARYITIKVATYDRDTETLGPSTQKFVKLENLPYWGTDSSDAGWTQITTTFTGPDNPFLVNDDETIIRIRIEFGNDDPLYLYPGSLMVTSPTLTYSPN